MPDTRYFSSLRDWFWNPNVWLMPGVSWEDMEPTSENGLPKLDDLILYSFILTILLLVLRYVLLEPLIVKPIGRMIGLKERVCKKPPYILELETIFLKYHTTKIPHKGLVDAAQQIGWSVQKVERWLRYRTASDKSSQMFKLCDCSWQLCYYSLYALFGIYALHDKAWFWDIRECWTRFPYQSIPNEIWWYYAIPLGFYINMCITFMFQHKRKDSLQMLLHHILTVILIFLSFVVNMVRCGALILAVHECADIPLLAAKISGYAGNETVMDVLFVVFILVWVATRLILFPCWILRSTLFEVHVILGVMYPIYYIFNGLLLMLLCFHVVWSYLIAKTILRKLNTKTVSDVRSDNEDISDEYDESDEASPKRSKKEI